MPEDGTDCDAGLAPVPETTVDDMDAIRPRTASYVRSSESYSHMGTLPRLLMRKRDKSKSNKGKEAEIIIRKKMENLRNGTTMTNFFLCLSLSLSWL